MKKNGKLPQVVFDAFVDEYTRIREEFFSKSFSAKVAITYNFTIDLDRRDEPYLQDCDQQESHRIRLESLLDNCEEAKVQVTEYKAKIKDFKERLKLACKERGATFEDKFSKIKRRA